MKVEALRQWRRLRRRRQWIVAGISAAMLLIAVAVALYFIAGRDSDEQGISLPPARPARTTQVPLNLPPPDLLRPITPEEALKENAERAFSSRPDTPAAGFKLAADESSRERALECMTQAVYYEAASEGQDGQRAVAQVVLNRMRHPAYPNTVCGVVYQGSERATGCQFTFTCDGSLARVPVASLWKQARRVATEALAGKVFGPVGHATHYHADYVLPYWADSLDKSLQVGRHIFYRLKSGLGASVAFRQRYGGTEPLPPLPSTVEVAMEAVENAGAELAIPGNETGLQIPAGELVASTQPDPELVADAMRGTLVLDGDASSTSQARPRRPEASDACPDAGSDPRLRPMSSTDLSSTSGRRC
jgi:spore germination cell wall hydrolase CwlJ-like protein